MNGHTCEVALCAADAVLARDGIPGRAKFGVAWLAMTMSHTPRSSAVLHVACPAPSPCRMAGRHLT